MSEPLGKVAVAFRELTLIATDLEETILRFPSLIQMERQSGYLNASTKERRHRNQNIKRTSTGTSSSSRKIETPGAPNENIVQNHFNIALLNIFWYLNGRYRHIFMSSKFFICSDFLAESLVIRKL